ncbi:fatty acid oxidation complex subunit alpha FadB [Pokkaliibacter sp. CJK22405]|uniref:fatty acid oxidation complex subunit alpha FadB n=1 Tax=Pokkaliibacter sp. CJK22405 TaxID=3384615 RepID=UPI003984FF3B
MPGTEHLNFQGQHLRCELIPDPNAADRVVAHVCFDAQKGRVNTLNQATLSELSQVLDRLESAEPCQGVLFSSAKAAFIVGADITEFGALFAVDEAQIAEAISSMANLFNRIEDLPMPTVALVNGLALGGGFELCLACDFRLLEHSSRVGLPEVKLGIFPGWGGTVRLPRLIGADNALEWICQGNEHTAEEALQAGAADGIIDGQGRENALLEAGLGLLANVAAAPDSFTISQRRGQKQTPLNLSEIEKMMVFESAKGLILGQTRGHYPAPLEALATLQKAARHSREQALAIEARCFAKLATTPQAAALTGLFLKDQTLKRLYKSLEAEVSPVRCAAVLGAGIMGAGIASQSAAKGVPVYLKDISQEALARGMQNAAAPLHGRVGKGRWTTEQLAAGLARLQPALSYGEFAQVDLAVEAVVEQPEAKVAVLKEAEAALGEDAILTSNTSTIAISLLAQGLARPQNFCGMHFFNPVHRMPLVEVIRGEQSSDAALATTLGYARSLGKTPILVNDCPGFLVNRILFPYLAGFMRLLQDGADFAEVDKVMEKMGWPMGPAYLLDVVGLDTACHGARVMAAGYPDRMATLSDSAHKTALTVLFEAGRLGQKNGQGFYQYVPDKRGKPQKKADAVVPELLAGVTGHLNSFTPEEIIDRLMIPLCIEAVRCLEDKVVSHPAEVDMGLIYGLGFPPFLGGALSYMDQIGLAVFCARADQLAELGALYQPTASLRAMAASDQRFYPQPSVTGGAA